MQAKSVKHFFLKSENKDLLQRLERMELNLEREDKPPKFSSEKKFVLMRPLEPLSSSLGETQKRLEALGVIVENRIDSKTDCIISNKDSVLTLEQARKLTNALTENQVRSVHEALTTKKSSSIKAILKQSKVKEALRELFLKDVLTKKQLFPLSEKRVVWSELEQLEQKTELTKEEEKQKKRLKTQKERLEALGAIVENRNNSETDCTVLTWEQARKLTDGLIEDQAKALIDVLTTRQLFPLSEKRVVLTGPLEPLSSSLGETQKRLEALGVIVENRIDSKTVCIIVGNNSVLPLGQARKLTNALTENQVNEVIHALTEDQSSPLSEKIYVFTGTLEGLSRTEATERLNDLGAIVSSNVSTKTDYVIVGKNPGSKLSKAETLGIDILTEKQLLALLEAKTI